ncbi:hypothetical protein Ahu01nite_012680 [Winogradskya humida]|uniref:Uncharacterized protein n=1 Tax=Winogradskya humida TaxID=113566 RepID=A0ABQ3ZHT7_9ACTN|nr:hypothetical protein Ahu01nite_012680 [Actinoplanes humidus]
MAPQAADALQAVGQRPHGGVGLIEAVLQNVDHGELAEGLGDQCLVTCRQSGTKRFLVVGAGMDEVSLHGSAKSAMRGRIAEQPGILYVGGPHRSPARSQRQRRRTRPVPS